MKKRKQMGLKIMDMYWLIGRNAKLSLENKILLYKTIIKPIWSYGAEIWGCASKSNSVYSVGNLVTVTGIKFAG
jgi:hypothetical protein